MAANNARLIHGGTEEQEGVVSDLKEIMDQLVQGLNNINASIEAARAGEMGKGFAVVATEVGGLATRSSQSANETNTLIMSTVEAIEEGRQISVHTMKVFDSMAEQIEKASKGVKDIAGMVRQKVSVVAQAMDGLEHISGVVEGNVELSQNSEQVSMTMAEEAGSLLKMVEPTK